MLWAQCSCDVPASAQEVNGPGEDPLFTFLKKEKGFEGFDLNHPIGGKLDEMMRKMDPDFDNKPDIKWNFTKFLVDQEGKVIARYEPTHDIKLIEQDIAKLLNGKSTCCCCGK